MLTGFTMQYNVSARNNWKLSQHMIFPSYSPCVGFLFSLEILKREGKNEALHFTPYSGKLGSNFLVVVTLRVVKPIGKLTKMDVSITLPTPAV